MDCFNYQEVADQAAIPQAKLSKLAEMMRREFPNDNMLYELHLLRACMAVRDGRISLENLLHDEEIVSSAQG